VTEVEVLVERICQLDDEMQALAARLDDDRIGSDANHRILERHMELSKEFIAVYMRCLLLTEPTDRPN
jgi:hypothetical protein